VVSLLLSACGGAQNKDAQPAPAPLPPPAPAAATQPAPEPMPSAEPKAETPPPPHQDPKLEQVFGDKEYQLTGVAISAKGRLFVNYPIWSPVHKYCVVEVMHGGEVKPYPNEEMNSWKPGEDGTKKFVSVQAVYIDDQDKLWVVDPANPQFAEVYKESDKLVRIDLATNKIERVYRMKGITDNHAYINDVRVDTKRQFAYMTNSNEGALLVIDLKSGKTRQVLKGTKVVTADPSYHFMIGGKEVAPDGKPLKVNSDGIALTPDHEWLYFKPLTDDKLYRVKTADLRDTTLSEDKLLAKVEDLGHVLITDGMEFDKHGNLYFGDMEHNSIVKITVPDLKKTTVVEDDRLIWPDSYSISKDGFLYISTSEVQTAPPFNGGVDKRTMPYGVFKLKLEP
ncbi:MAG TPA: L-dopachrome tautomerase-related protein, partial [Polyangiaceae bacterium]